MVEIKWLAQVDKGKCVGCRSCENVCPTEAVNVVQLESPDEESITPCRLACPAEIDIQGYVAHINRGEFSEALKLIKEKNPLPLSVGRVCPHFCEDACRRNLVDQPVAINPLKRFVADYDQLNGIPFKPQMEPENGHKVAIIGGGPGGLSAAYYLRLRGYGVTIFEAKPQLGGMLRYGIPEYRLPKKILDQEIKGIREMGVEIKTGVTFGKDISLKSIEADGYKAVFLATGLHLSRRLNIDNEDLEGVLKGVDFLGAVSPKYPVSLGKRVVVIGGGNVAIDVALTAIRQGADINSEKMKIRQGIEVALTAIRQGAEDVSLVCLEKRDEMPAWKNETQQALEEGVKIINGLGPNKFLEKDGQLSAIEFKRCTSVFNENGAFDPQYDATDLTVFEADTAIVAIGQAADLSFAKEQGIPIGSQGRLEADPLTLATSLPGVFSGGDCTLGPASFVEAVTHGRRAAESIHNYLEHGGLREVKLQEKPVDLVLTDEEKKRARPIERQIMPMLPLEKRKGNFAEVNLGFTEEMAKAEGQRCLSCSLCSQCSECVRACGPQAIDLNEQERILELEVGAIVVATGIDIFDANKYSEYGYGRYPDVITNLQYERLCNASGPTGGQVLRPSDGKVPQSIVFIQCVGSRDKAKGFEYCSKVCCMISAKHLTLFKHHNPGGQAYVFYIDNRAGGKGYEEFLRRAIEEANAQYIRGRVAKVFQEGGRLVVRGENSLLGIPVEVEADLVVLATGLTAQKDYRSVARAFNIPTDKYGFFIESHPKLGPVETALAGIYLAGGAQGPKDIPESVAQGGAAAAEALALFSLGMVEVEPTVASVDEQLCTGCRTCVDLCAYKAISFSDLTKMASINEALCQGCGTCAAACPMAAIRVRHYMPEQIFSQIEGILA